MTGFVRCLTAGVIVVALGACQATVAPQAFRSLDATATATLGATPSAAPSQACDPIDQVFAAMFIGLSEAALSNAGIKPEEFFAALAGDREKLKTYFAALGIPLDDAWIDAAMSSHLGQRLLRQSLGDASPGPSGGEWVVC